MALKELIESSDAFQAKLKKDLTAQRKKMVNDAKTSVQAMVKLMERAPDRNTMDAMLEAFAMVPNAKGLEDIHNFFDVQLKGGQLDGKNCHWHSYSEFAGCYH